ncbi:MAG: hypothetical protein H0W27_06870 [Actinobacteria bacterium]|nr:hypothetical protein [Actinomycetota bacterium]
MSLRALDKASYSQIWGDASILRRMERENVPGRAWWTTGATWVVAPSLSASVVLIFLVASAVLFRTPPAWAACYDEEAIFVYEPSMSQAYGSVNYFEQLGRDLNEACPVPQLSPATVSTSRLANVSFDKWAEAGIREENNFITHKPHYHFFWETGVGFSDVTGIGLRAPPRTLWLR